MDFEEFMRVFATYCMYTEEDILRCKPGQHVPFQACT